MTYQDLRREVQAAGLLDRSGWYSLPLALVTVVFGLASFAVLVTAPGAWRFAAVPLLSLFWIQIGFFGHDLGHKQVFPSSERNRIVGIFCYPLLLGMTYRPWVIKHNLHHADTNVEESDPDLQNPLLAFTEQAARERRGMLRWLVRYQAYAYPFLALFATAGFRIDAWRYTLTGTTIYEQNEKYDRERRTELVFLFGNLLLWLVIPTIALGPVTWLPVFVLGQMLLGLHMAFVFAPNHKGMPTFTEETRLTFLDQQVLTSRNVTGGPLVDFMYGGLNYQIEHHLFPTMPRQNFPACRTIVQRFCAEIALTYTEESVIQSFKSLFSSMDEIGQLVFEKRPLEAATVTGTAATPQA